MSTQRGNAARTRAQKHKNRHVFKNDLHDKTPQQKKINSLHVSEVCQHCKQVIEWKIKYKKYKPLSQPTTCVKCQQRNVRKAYHVICRGCALSQKVCAKCLKTADEVEIEPPLPTPVEELKLTAEMERLVKTLPERKRRAFRRYMRKGKVEEIATDEKENASDVDEEDGEGATEKPAVRTIPHSREALLKKLEELKIGDENDLCGFDNSDEDDEDDDGSEDDSDSE